MAQIGIKLADGSFFPVIADDSAARKRLVLTVANADQPTAQVDLLRRGDTGDQFVGCLVLEGIADSEIGLILAVDDHRNVEASLSTAEQYQSLSVNLEQIEEISAFSLPDEAGGDIGAVAGVDDSVEPIDVPDLDSVSFEDGLEPPFSAEELDLPEGGDAIDALADLSEEGEPALESPEEFERDALESPALPDADLLDAGIDYAHNEDVGDGQDLDQLDDELFGADSAVSGDEVDATDGASYDASERFGEDIDYDREYVDDEPAAPAVRPRRLRPLVLAALILIAVSAVLLAAYGVFRLLRTEPLPDLRSAYLALPLIARRPEAGR